MLQRSRFLGDHSCARCLKGVALCVLYGTVQTEVPMKWSECPPEGLNMGSVVEA